MHLYDKFKTYEIIGIPSGDFENETFDVPYDEFVKITGKTPPSYAKSVFYVDLYRLYGVPIPKEIRDSYKGDKLIKVKVTVSSQSEITDVPVKYRYNGYENDEFFNIDD
jgi:hypothetical protein